MRTPFSLKNFQFAQYSTVLMFALDALLYIAVATDFKMCRCINYV